MAQCCSDNEGNSDARERADKKVLAKRTVFVHLWVSNDGFCGEEEADGFAEVSDHEGDDESAFEPANVPAGLLQARTAAGWPDILDLRAEVFRDTSSELAPPKHANQVARSEHERMRVAQCR